MSKMFAKILLGGALFLRLVAPAAAMPNFLGRDVYCTATVTVYSTIGDSSSPSSSPNSISSPPPLDPGSGPVTVTVLDTTTIVSTIYALSSPGAQVTGSPNSGDPQTVTVTVTSVATSVETRTIVQTQTVTQVVSQTLAQAAGAQTSINGGFYKGPGEFSVTYTTVTSTFTTTNTIIKSSAGAGIPPQPSSRPYYSNGTGISPYTNSSNRIIANPLSPTSSLRLLDPPPASTTAPLASYSTSSSSSNYENGLYFVNWSVRLVLPRNVEL